MEVTVHACLAEHPAGQGYDLGISFGPGAAYDLGAELPEFPEPPFLGTLIPEAVVEVVEFDWAGCALEFADVEPKDGGCEFGAQGYFAVAFILEVVYLTQDAFAGF